MSPSDERRQPISPQLALRVAVLGGIALTLFAVVFFRLWFLQVLSGEQYVSEARENRTRAVRIAAPRGQILDRRGNEIVTNRSARVVQIAPDKLPERSRRDAAEWGRAVGLRQRKRPEFRGPRVKYPPIATAELRDRYVRLGRVLNMRAETIHRRVVEQLTRLPYAPVTVASDVEFAKVAFLKENKADFPGVDVEQVFLRRYPKTTLAAQLLGTVGRVTPEQSRQKRFRDVDRNAVVGQTGLEYQYDRYLRGRDGARVLRVDANGQLYGQARRRREPTPGRDLRLSLDLDLQKAGQDALAQIGGGLPGAFVAMNPHNGQVYAMGSYPSFDPTVYTKPISDERYQRLFGESAGSPQVNRAIQGFYPTGSTFKPLTAMAAMDAGALSPTELVFDGGTYKIGNRIAKNAGGAAYGSIDVRKALQVSSTVFFYKLGEELYAQGGEQLQRWARRFGLGRKTGIDLPSEAPGTIPGRAWRERLNKREAACRRDPDQPEGRPCFAAEIRPYNVGDNVNLAIGQGEIAASPLQMAVAYSTIVTKGRVPRPHLGLEVMDKDGGLVQEIDSDPARKIKMSGAHRDAVLDGMGRGAMVPPGTSSAIFAQWPKDRLPVFGKTGTAQTFVDRVEYDQSWYVSYVKAGKGRSIVVAATVERGGFGAERAAPIACRVLRTWFDLEQRVCEPAAAGVRVAQDR